jgi:hypothetical protein
LAFLALDDPHRFNNHAVLGGLCRLIVVFGNTIPVVICGRSPTRNLPADLLLSTSPIFLIVIAIENVIGVFLVVIAAARIAVSR